MGDYRTFTRDEWAALPADPPLASDDAEVVEVYLPLSRLLRDRAEVAPATFVIGLAGSVAVGKSTTARTLQELVRRWRRQPTVELVTTDGFLHPNAELDARGLMTRKGFPESYDVPRLVEFLDTVRAGARAVAPVYSHELYDVVPGGEQVVDAPDVVIVEGVNVLQLDRFDVSIYVDADEDDIVQWYLERFLVLRGDLFRDRDEAIEVGTVMWHEINGRNLRENILPTRARADVVLRKDADHRVAEVQLRET